MWYITTSQLLKDFESALMDLPLQYRGVITEFLGEEKPMGGRNLPP